MLHEHASARTLALARVWTFTLCLVDVAQDSLRDLVGLPLDYLTPVGPLALLPRAWLAVLYAPAALAILKAALCVLLALSIIGAPGFRGIAIVACALLTVYYALLRSFGYVNHAELAMLYVAYVLAVAPSADAWALRRRSGAVRPEVYAASMALASLLFCLTYVLVAAHRTTMGGPPLFREASVTRILLGPALKPGVFGISYGPELLATPLGRNAMAAGFLYVTVLELLAPVCLFAPRFRRLWLVSMAGFHVATLVLMQVFFAHNLALMPLLLLDVDWWLAKLGLEPARASR